jgi:hypothetical protein
MGPARKIKNTKTVITAGMPMIQKELSPYLKASSVDTSTEVAPSHEAASERKIKVDDNPREAKKKSSRVAIFLEKIKLTASKITKYPKRRRKDPGHI